MNTDSQNVGSPKPPPVIGKAPPIKDRPPLDIDAEQEFGAKVLPWIGAISVVVGLIYLVNYAIQKAIITPEMQMAGAAVLSAIFAGFGIVLARGSRDSKVFGNLLVGLGSCGLYMTAAGGYAGWKLITGETMVGGFILLAFANLLYGYWRSLSPFVLMGITGGGIASAMLGHQGDYLLAAGILALIGVPAYIALIARRAPYWVGGVWLAGTLSILVWDSQAYVVGVEYLIAVWMLAGLGSHLAAFRRTEKAYEMFTPSIIAALGIGHIYSCSTQGWLAASLLLTVGLACGLMAAFASSNARLTMLVVATLTAGLAAPARLTQDWMLLAFAATGFVLLLLASRVRKELSVLGLFNLAIATLLYVAVIGEPTVKWLPFDERVAIPLLVGTVIGSAIVLYKMAKSMPQFKDIDFFIRVTAACAAWGLVIRFTQLQIGLNEWGPATMTIGWGLCAVLTFLVGSWLRAKELRVFGLGLLMLTLGRTMMVELARLESVYKVMILICVGILSLAISYLFYIRPNRSDVKRMTPSDTP